MEYDMNSMTRAVLLAASLSLLAGAVEAQKKPVHATQKVYRWVDENGEVHFSESLPPDFQDRKHDVLDKQGMTQKVDQSLAPPPPKPSAAGEDELPRDSSGMPRAKPRYNAAQLQAQQDSLLLLRYDSELEILDAKKVEVKQLDYDRQVLLTSQNSLQQSYRGNIREAAERQRAGVQVEDKLTSDIRALRQRLASNEAALAELQIREESIDKKFDAELERYRTLVAAKEGDGR
jgi:hypothetical protein